jgi:hypothetical protein
MPTRTSSNYCLRYWDLADHIRIDDAIALLCGVEPAALQRPSAECGERGCASPDAQHDSLHLLAAAKAVAAIRTMLGCRVPSFGIWP